jgi:hypothetical protein
MNPSWPLSPSTLDHLWAQHLHRETAAVIGDLGGRATFDGRWAVRVARQLRGHWR